MKKSLKLSLVMLTASAIVLSGCAGADEGPKDGKVALEYWMWDDQQVPGYQECAAAFTAENPDITVNVTQYAWDDYWTKITASFVGGAGPDVFTMQLGRLGAFIDQSQIVALDDYLAKDPVDFGQYRDGLVEAWVGPEGDQYGLPKDWDTTALFFNTDMLADAGVAVGDVADLTWNPEDGGTFEALLAKLTVDKNGVRGNEAGFDKNNVAVFGLGVNADYNLHGQTSWADFALSTGWQYLDENPWGTKIGFSDPQFQSAVGWYFGLAEKGFMPKAREFSTGQTDQFGSGKAATILEGTWNAIQIYGYDGITPVIAAAPEFTGTGKSATLYNSLSDSISSVSKNKDQAWQWVRFMASPACQDLVAKQGVILPSIQTSTDIALATFATNGIDLSPTDKYFGDKGSRETMPLVRNSAKADATAALVFENIHLGKVPASDLTKLTPEIDAIIAK